MIQEVAPEDTMHGFGAEKAETWPSKPPRKPEPMPSAMRPSMASLSVFTKIKTARFFPKVGTGPYEHEGSHCTLNSRRGLAKLGLYKNSQGTLHLGPHLESSWREEEAHSFFCLFFFRLYVLEKL